MAMVRVKPAFSFLEVAGFFPYQHVRADARDRVLAR
jgi:hypothetical protein